MGDSTETLVANPNPGPDAVLSSPHRLLGSLFDTSTDPAVAAAVRDAVLEMIDEEMENEMDITDGGAEAGNALDSSSRAPSTSMP